MIWLGGSGKEGYNDIVIPRTWLILSWLICCMDYDCFEGGLRRRRSTIRLDLYAPTRRGDLDMSVVNIVGPPLSLVSLISSSHIILIIRIDTAPSPQQSRFTLTREERVIYTRYLEEDCGYIAIGPEEEEGSDLG